MKTYFTLLSFILFSFLVTSGAKATNVETCINVCTKAYLDTNTFCKNNYSGPGFAAQQAGCLSGSTQNKSSCDSYCTKLFKD